MKNSKSVIAVIITLVMFSVLFITSPAIFAQETDEEATVQSGTIMKIDLGVQELSLAVGESYTFQVTFEPADTALTTLD